MRDIDLACQLGLNHPMGPLTLADFYRARHLPRNHARAVRGAPADPKFPSRAGAGEVCRGGVVRPQDGARLLRLFGRGAGADALAPVTSAAAARTGHPRRSRNTRPGRRPARSGGRRQYDSCRRESGAAQYECRLPRQGSATNRSPRLHGRGAAASGCDGIRTPPGSPRHAVATRGATAPSPSAASANSSTSAVTVAEVAFIASARSRVTRFHTNSPVAAMLAALSLPSGRGEADDRRAIAEQVEEAVRCEIAHPIRSQRADPADRTRRGRLRSTGRARGREPCDGRLVARRNGAVASHAGLRAGFAVSTEAIVRYT